MSVNPKTRDPNPRRSGEPCWHRGCQAHRTHPCEGCGRLGAKGEYWGHYVMPDEIINWPRQYMCTYWDDDGQGMLKRFAWAYLTETEDFDQQICWARKGKIAVPLSRDERRECLQHAARCFRRYVKLAQDLRLAEFCEKPLRLAISKVERQWEDKYQPKA